eukprot:11156236-Lingulodinium_polyedra.AAC.1
MADDESSEDDPNYWTDRRANVNRPKEGKGNAFPSKTPFPKVIGKVSPTWPGGKGVYAEWLVPKLYDVGPP